MKVRLTRKLAECIDGVNLNGHEVGDVVEFLPAEAQILIVEQWAVPHEIAVPSSAGPVAQSDMDAGPTTATSRRGVRGSGGGSAGRRRSRFGRRQ